jgi:hypothetical protein
MKASISTLFVLLLGATFAGADQRGDLEKMAAEHQGDHPAPAPAARRRI